MLKSDGYLRPVVLQVTGVVLLVAFAGVWFFTGHESALLVGASLTLVSVGSASGAIVTVRQEIESKAEQQRGEKGKRDGMERRGAGDE